MEPRYSLLWPITLLLISAVLFGGWFRQLNESEHTKFFGIIEKLNSFRYYLANGTKELAFADKESGAHKDEHRTRGVFEFSMAETSLVQAERLLAEYYEEKSRLYSYPIDNCMAGLQDLRASHRKIFDKLLNASASNEIVCVDREVMLLNQQTELFLARVKNSVVAADKDRRKFSLLVALMSFGALLLVGMAFIRGETNREKLGGELEKYQKTLEEMVEERSDALAKNESRLRAILQAMPDEVCLINSYGQVVEHLSRVSTDKGGDEQSSLLIMPAATLKELFHDAIEAGQPLTAEFEVSFCGTDKWIEGRCVPLNITPSPTRFAILLTRDITERKKHDQLRDLQVEINSLIAESSNLDATLQQIINIICQNQDWSYGSFWYCPPGQSQIKCHIQWANDNAKLEPLIQKSETMKFVRGQYIIGRTWHSGQPEWTSDLTRLADNERVQLAIEAGMQAAMAIPVVVEKSCIGVMTFLWHGNRKPEEELIASLCGHGAQIGSLIMRRESQNEMLLAKETAENANKAKSLFLANMSHEIRTPMNAILGMIFLLFNTELTSRQKTLLHKLQSSGQLLLQLINDILDISKIESGYIEIEHAQFAPNHVFSDIAEMFKHRARAKNLRLFFDIDTNLPSLLVGDPLRLTQILINLISNAIKFTPRGEVRLTVNSLMSDHANILLRFSVRDTGIGISEEQRDKIFKPFTQADPSITRKYGGTGLGLVISKSLLKLMGSELVVKSQPGRGSEFIFDLSFQIHQKSRHSGALSAQLTQKPVLIVEADADYRDAVQKSFTGFGFNCVTCNDIQACWRMLEVANPEEFPFSLIAVAKTFSNEEGASLLRRVKEKFGLTGNPPFIFISYDTPDNQAIEDISKLKVSHIYHPATPSNWYDAIMMAMGREVIKTSTETEHESMVNRWTTKLRGLRILIAEDNIINQELCRDLLSMAGIESQIAANGVQAVQMVKNNNFDLVLMDVHMPEQDGFTATRKIREMPGFETLPIIALTAGATTGERQEAEKSGMQDFVTKPIEPELLFATIARWTNRQNNSGIAGEFFDAEEDSQDEAANSTVPVELKGLDTRGALQRTGGDVDKWCAMLKKFADNQSGKAEEIGELLATARKNAAREIAHALKGVAANLGLSAVARHAGELHEALRGNDTQQQSIILNELKKSMTETLEIIRSIPDSSNENNQTPCPEMPRETLLNKLYELENALRESDFTSTAIFNEIKPFLRVPSHLLLQLETDVSRFQFTQAIETLAQIKTAVHNCDMGGS